MLGSVFSPYYAWARDRGQANPLDHCALNVALYGADNRRWAMTERGHEAVEQTPRLLRIGPSTLRWDGQALVIDIDEVTAPLPRRLRGQVRVYPRAINPEDFALDAAGRHRWWPIAPLSRVEVAFERPDLSWSGAGYLDSNRGSEPLEDAFLRWNWSRTLLRNGDAAALYDVTARPGLGAGASLALRFDGQGRVERIAPPPGFVLPSSGIWRIPRGTGSESGTPPQVVKTLEDTPFYVRSLVESQLFGERATFMHESLCLNRFAANWVRVLLPFRMPRATKKLRLG